MTRHAVCSCRQLHLTIEGEPSRNAMCHCLAYQRRTVAVISNQARFRNEPMAITDYFCRTFLRAGLIGPGESE